MPIPRALRQPRTYIVAIPILVLLVAVVAPWAYINFVKEDADDPLTFADITTTTSDTSTDSTDATDATDTSASATTTAGAGDGIDGTWTVTTGSQAGYRVDEVLFGQDSEATGRTTDVTGQIEISGTTATSATVEVDLTTLTSGEDQRDSAVRGRILETNQFPTATFTLTEAIDLGSLPADQAEVTVEATGDLTIHGVTRRVTFELTARRNGATIEALGTIPVTFADFDIDDPSGGPATVKGDGEIEFALAFTLA